MRGGYTFHDNTGPTLGLCLSSPGKTKTLQTLHKTSCPVVSICYYTYYKLYPLDRLQSQDFIILTSHVSYPCVMRPGPEI